MPFIVPFIPLIAAGIGATVGGVSAAKEQGIQQKGLSEQEAIAQQEMQDKQKIFNQLMPFFQQYMTSGSPYLAQTQRASAEQVAQGANEAAGRVRNTLQTSGLGYGPSGTTGAAIADVGAGAAASGASNYLQNLLANEQLKFQAASGLNQAGQMVGSPQNQPSVSTQLPPANLGSSIFGGAQAIGSTIPGAGGGSTGGGNLPLPPTGPVAQNPSIIFGMPGQTPTTGGGGSSSDFGWGN